MFFYDMELAFAFALVHNPTCRSTLCSHVFYCNMTIPLLADYAKVVAFFCENPCPRPGQGQGQGQGQVPSLFIT